MPEPLPPSYGLRHVALRVRDLKAAEAFYCGQLGFRVEWRPDAEPGFLPQPAEVGYYGAIAKKPVRP